jgi:hypothetical protein
MVADRWNHAADSTAARSNRTARKMAASDNAAYVRAASKRAAAARIGAARMSTARKRAAWMGSAGDHAATDARGMNAANLADACSPAARTFADAYGLTNAWADWATDGWTTNGSRSSWKTRNRLISITAQTAAGAAEGLDLNHQIFQFERFHSFPPWEGGREAFVTRLRVGKGR